jgi:hypothetical protein
MRSAIIVFAAGLFAQMPDHIRNGVITQHPVSGSLASAIEDVARSTVMENVAGPTVPVWAGYAVPAAMLKPGLLSQSDCCSDCSLEYSGNRYYESTPITSRPVVPHDLFTFVRFERGQVTRVRSFTSDCTVDATGTSVQWLSPVAPADSIAYLLSLAQREDVRRFSSTIIGAIALHEDPGADAALEKLVAAGQPTALREQAAFWLAAEETQHAIDLLRRLAREDTDETFRRSLTFPLSISSNDAALEELIRMAHNDSASSVRGQALFWMAQQAGSRLEREIVASIENDPDTEVKKRAVFALSQMPHGDGIPKLIEVARANKNSAVRKQAVFWLGQSHDERALTFIEGILTR